MPSSSKGPNAQAGSSRSWKPTETIVSDRLNSEGEEETEHAMKVPTGLRERPWLRSPSPPESWDDAEGALDDGSWPVKIVGEEVDYWGDVRCETRWETWSRPDGTNTTWKDEYIDDDPLRVRKIRSTWDKMQKKRRKKLLDENRDIELCRGVDIHNNDTRHRAQAYDEKKATTLPLKDSFSALYAKSKRKETQYLRDDEDLMEVDSQEGEIRVSKRQSMSKTASTQSSRSLSSTTWSDSVSQPRHRVLSSTPGTTTRPTPTPSTASNRTSSSRRSTPSAYRLFTPAASSVTLPSETPSSSSWSPFPDSAERPPMSEKARGKQPMRSETISFSPRPQSPRPMISRRSALSKEWSRWGAPITFCNDVDDEDVPPLCSDFKYIERGYEYDTGLEHLAGDSGFLVGCSGHQSCSPRAIGGCDCQDETSFTDQKSGRKLCAYDSKGLFGFKVPAGIEVLECTPNCECLLDCPNRVLQRERVISLQVFKTTHRGWGVRAAKQVKKGTVLGMYTGLLIRRDDASDGMDYCFDLDGQENLDEDSDAETGDRYSVDSETRGNWTRFINHSCDPNLAIYEAVYDLPPGQGTPYLAYAALRDIPPGEEFTFNYNPKIEEEVHNTKKSIKFRKGANGKRVPVGRRECHCGTEVCRGYF